MVDTSDEWITERTGIKERRINKGTPAAQLASEAALRALEDAKIGAEEIDVIIATTIGADYLTPSLSCMIQKETGVRNAFCFDINAACSGFVYALDVANAYIKSGRASNILIVSAEMLSRYTDYTDRSTCVLFGDGTAAVVVRAGEQPGMISGYLKSNGSMGDVLEVANRPGAYLTMNGREVYKFAVRVNVETITHLMEENGLTFGDIKYIIPHQANKRIIEGVAAKLKCPLELFYMNVEKYGNTSSASVPICLDELNKAGKLQTGDKIIMVGFGGGLTYAGAFIEWV